MYEVLGEYYDKFMTATDADQWAKYLSGFIGKRKRGVDQGCGTGRITLALTRLGYDVTGADPSREMLSEAAANALKSGMATEFVLSSAEKFVYPHAGADFVTACCDVVNYMCAPEKFFASAYAGLSKGGVLLFDVSSAYKLKNVIGNNTFTDEADDVTYVWTNSAGKKAVDMIVTFFAPDGNNHYTKAVERQKQYIYEPDELKAKLEKAGFGKVAVYGFMTRRAPKANEERLQFIAYKE